MLVFPMDIDYFSQPKNINWLFLQTLSCLCSVSGATLELGHKDWLLNIETNPWSEPPDWTHDWSLLWFKLVQWTMKFCLKLAKKVFFEVLLQDWLEEIKLVSISQKSNQDPNMRTEEAIFWDFILRSSTTIKHCICMALSCINTKVVIVSNTKSG